MKAYGGQVYGSRNRVMVTQRRNILRFEISLILVYTVYIPILIKIINYVIHYSMKSRINLLEYKMPVIKMRLS